MIKHRPYLKRSVSTALVVGFVLFAINHLDEVLRGWVSPMVWVKIVSTFFVPFVVSNVGILIATRATCEAKRGSPSAPSTFTPSAKAKRIDFRQ